MICSKCGKECNAKFTGKGFSSFGRKAVSFCCEAEIITEEKKMEKIKFENDDQLIEFFKTIFDCDVNYIINDKDRYNVDKYVEKARDKGYIKQTKLEIAYERYLANEYNREDSENLITEQRLEIERLKNER